ncbi:hypothetical protein FD13_GL000296 [Levilactobacillus senmaizukei DSM 21775 = NBRC 103853]|uniref:IraD/Gp25-like domain-containing protein n=1 Tax=Levilactobacillus senmaizukei DSM 21775 = NBRC 103853 TaxID=1423803 RepID=A0A0R2DPE3_9LACO|nr:hypothetical protein [Levilactobacillus senmaizukei]KRN02156.1 hypothetical protein FD13_GL000296 [Levilactobacillus senmaizukei DSM 21775 = NBRC 103853]
MVDFALDDQNDAAYNSDTNDIDKDESLIHRVLVFLNTNIGELPWNVDFGIDLSQVMLDIHDQAALTMELDEWVTARFEDEVENIEVTGITYSKRQAHINMVLTTIDGDLINLEKGVDDDGSD